MVKEMTPLPAKSVIDMLSDFQMEVSAITVLIVFGASM